MTGTCHRDGCDHPIPARRKFCSPVCSYAGQARPGRRRGKKCRSGKHLMVGANVRTDSRGHRSCKACAADAERRRTSATPKPVRTKTVKPAPAAKRVNLRKRWRPAGWLATPANLERRTVS